MGFVTSAYMGTDAVRGVTASPGLVTLAQIAARLRVSRRALLRIRQQSATFPKPVNLGFRRAVVYRATDIQNWIKARKAA